MYISENLVKRMKETFMPGTRIQLDLMGDDPRPIPPGTKGTVRHVDDMGTVHCNFDNGRSLGLIPGEDSFRAITEGRVWTLPFPTHRQRLQWTFLSASIPVYSLSKTPMPNRC